MRAERSGEQLERCRESQSWVLTCSVCFCLCPAGAYCHSLSWVVYLCLCRSNNGDPPLHPFSGLRPGLMHGYLDGDHQKMPRPRSREIAKRQRVDTVKLDGSRTLSAVYTFLTKYRGSACITVWHSLGAFQKFVSVRDISRSSGNGKVGHIGIMLVVDYKVLYFEPSRAIAINSFVTAASSSLIDKSVLLVPNCVRNFLKLPKQRVSMKHGIRLFTLVNEEPERVGVCITYFTFELMLTVRVS